MNLKNIFSEYYDQSSILVLVHFTNIALNLLITVAHNCHIKTKCPHQIQITHSKFKLLTANYKSTTANYKSFTSNTNHSQQIKNHSQQIRSQQIQIIHITYKSSHQIQVSAKTNRSQQTQIRSVKRGLQTADCGPGEKAD